MIENFFPSNGEFLHYKLIKNDNKFIPLVVIGSWKIIIEDCMSFVEQFGDRTILLIECRGMGLSTCRSSFSIQDCSQDVINLVKHIFNGHPVHIIGFSLGGNIALNAVLIDESLFYTVSVFATKLKKYSTIEFQDYDFKFYDGFDFALDVFPRYLFSAKWLKQENSKDIVSNYFNKFKSNHPLCMRLRYEKSLINTVYFGKNEIPTYNISIPILAVFGEVDKNVPPCYTTLFKNKFSNVSVSVLKETGHLMWISNPQDCAKLVNKFFKTIVNNKPFQTEEYVESTGPKFTFSEESTSKMYELLKTIKEIFDLFEITYWISWGTLLGAVRHKGFIPWDYDVDFCVLEDELAKIEKTMMTFALLGINIMLRGHGGYKGYNISMRTETQELPVDIFVLSEVVKDGKLVYSTTEDNFRWENEYFIKSDVFPLKNYTFGNLELPGPQKYKEYLDRIYKDWEIKAVVDRRCNFVIENSEYFSKLL